MSKAHHTHHGPAKAGMSHDKLHYGGKPPEHPHHGHPIHHKRARGGGIGDDEKVPREEVYEGAGSDTLKEAERKKHGGAAMKKAPMHVAGHASRHHRLDRRGRKSGGSVGADSHPMTEASKLTGGGSTAYKMDSEDD